MNHCFVSYELALRTYTGCRSSFKESTMLHSHVSTVAQNGRTKKLAQDWAFCDGIQRQL